MRISSAFPSKYLRAADLDGRQITVEIERVDMEDVATGEEPKPVIYFAGKSKGVVLNKTNANSIASAYGDLTEDWPGQQVILFSAHVDFQGRSVEAIRIKIPPRKPQQRAMPSKEWSEPPTAEPVKRPPITSADIDGDDIPF